MWLMSALDKDHIRARASAHQTKRNLTHLLAGCTIVGNGAATGKSKRVGCLYWTYNQVS